MSKGRHRARRIGQPQPNQPRPAAPSQNARPLPVPVSATTQGTTTPATPPAIGVGQAVPRPETTHTPPPSSAAAARQATTPPIRKDQQRALTAHAWASAAKDQGEIANYETAVQNFAAALLRSGLAVAGSLLERSVERKAFALLLDNLAGWPLPGITTGAGRDWPGKVRAIADLGQYMQATRELIALLGWLRRASRAVQVEGPR